MDSLLEQNSQFCYRCYIHRINDKEKMVNESLKETIEKVKPGSFHAFYEGDEFNYLLLIDDSGYVSKGFRDSQSFYESVFLKRIYPALCESGDIEKLGKYKVFVCKDRNSGLKSLLTSIAEEKLKGLRDLHEHEVKASVSESRFHGTSAQINVLIYQYGTPKLCGAVLARLGEVKPIISKIIGSDKISLHANGQTPSYYVQPKIWPDDADNYDDYDDEDENPNWPSKTGNKSGGDRGNNPPKK